MCVLSVGTSSHSFLCSPNNNKIEFMLTYHPVKWMHEMKTSDNVKQHFYMWLDHYSWFCPVNVTHSCHSQSK